MDIAKYLPTEIIVNILWWLPTKDIKNVRLVSKFFNDVAAQFVFETLYISTKLKDREIFTAVSEHPLLSSVVREVVFDAANITLEDRGDRLALNRESYTRFLEKRWEDINFTSASVEYCTKAALYRGYRSFLKDYYDQSRLASYNGDDLTRNSDILSRPADFSSLLMDQKNHGDLVKYLPDDLVRLVHGLPRMPRVRRFKITDCRYSNTVKYREQWYSEYRNVDIMRLSVFIKNPGCRGIDEVILNPRPWPSTTEQGEALNRSWYRGFFVLVQAASMTNMTTLESFKVERDCIKSGLSHAVFSMSPRELFHTMNAFRNLRIIQLKIQTATFEGNGWDTTIARGDLAQIFGAAKHLEILDLRIDEVNTNPVYFANFLGTHTWPKLVKFTLASVKFKLDRNGFLDFFERHRFTLRSLWLEEVRIETSEQTANVGLEMEELKYEVKREKELSNRWSSWNEILSAMASGPIALTNITFFQNNFGPRPAGWVFHSCDAATVYDFLHSGGLNRPRVPCQHTAQSFWFEKDR